MNDPELSVEARFNKMKENARMFRAAKAKSNQQWLQEKLEQLRKDGIARNRWVEHFGANPEEVPKEPEPDWFVSLLEDDDKDWIKNEVQEEIRKGKEVLAERAAKELLS